MHWIDKATLGLAPRWTLRRIAARARAEVLAHYESGAVGRRTQGWNRASSDANAANATGGLSTTRNTVRDLVRNNPYAASALATIVDHTVGYGITAKPDPRASRALQNRAEDLWERWAETPACDADGRHDLAGLEKLVVRTVAQDGEVLVRRRLRRPTDGLPIPMQLQVIEADYLDTQRDGVTLPNGGRIIQGVEYSPIGQRVGYWLFSEHPGSGFLGARGSSLTASSRIDAQDILHVFKTERPGQVRATSWFAPVVLRMRDFDDYEDAALMKQKIAACLAVIITDTDGTSTALGTADDTATPAIDLLSPGMIANFPMGKTATVVQPPTVSEHDGYSKTILRAIAAGLGVTYEDLTGCYDGLPFSAARMSRLRHWARVDDWRWRMLIPQFCDPVWSWAMRAAAIGGPELPLIGAENLRAEWTCPPMPLLDPEGEGRALQGLVRIGALTWPEMIRERGYDPEAVLAEIAAWNKKLDALGVTLDCDPRKTSQQGQAIAPSAPAPAPAMATPNGNGNGNGTGAYHGAA